MTAQDRRALGKEHRDAKAALAWIYGLRPGWVEVEKS